MIRRHEVGPRSSQAVVSEGPYVHLAGQVARNSPGADAGAQTREILARVDELLATAGTGKSRIVQALVFLSDWRHFDAMNEVWIGWLAPGETPARAVVEGRLVSPDFFVEIMITATVPRDAS